MFLSTCSRLLLSALISTFVLASPTAQAREAGGDFGLGVIFGAPTALSAKFNFGRNEAFDLGLAFDFDDYVLLYGDYMMHFPGAFGRSSRFVASLRPYVGIGPILVIDSNDRRRNDKYLDDDDDDFALGARVPLGVEWRAPNFPLGIAVEIVPGLIVIPGTDGFVQGGIAFRYYF